MPDKQVFIFTDYITLVAFLKWVNVVGSGGAAKTLIAGRQISVNGVTETRRGRKLYPGDRAQVDDGHFFAIVHGGT